MRLVLIVLALASCPAHAQVAAYRVEGGAIAAPLDGLSGDAARGRAIVANRQKGLCLLCHSGPFPEERFQGDLAPSLAGAGSRNTVGELRLRMVDSRSVNPAGIMPSYHVGAGHGGAGQSEVGNLRVAPALAGKPILSAQEIEDVVAFLQALKE